MSLLKKIGGGLAGRPVAKSFKSKRPKKPAKTAEQEAIERRTRSLLDKEIEEAEERFKALRRGTLGRQSLLSGAPKTAAEARGVGRRSSGAGVGSLLGGGLSRGSSGGAGYSQRNIAGITK